MSLVVHPRESIAAKRIPMTKSDPGSHYIDVAIPRLIAKVTLFVSIWIAAGLPVPASEPEIVSPSAGSGIGASTTRLPI